MRSYALRPEQQSDELVYPFNGKSCPKMTCKPL